MAYKTVEEMMRDHIERRGLAEANATDGATHAMIQTTTDILTLVEVAMREENVDRYKITRVLRLAIHRSM